MHHKHFQLSSGNINDLREGSTRVRTNRRGIESEGHSSSVYGAFPFLDFKLSCSWFGREEQKRTKDFSYSGLKNGAEKNLRNLLISRLVEQSICITEVISVFLLSPLEDWRIDIKDFMEKKAFSLISYRALLLAVIRGFFDRTPHAVGKLARQKWGATSSEEVDLLLISFRISSFEWILLFFLFQSKI